MNEAVTAFLRMEQDGGHTDGYLGGQPKASATTKGPVGTTFAKQTELKDDSKTAADAQEIEILDLMETKSTATPTDASEEENAGKNADLFERLDILAKEEKLQEKKDQAASKRKEGNEWFEDQKYGMAIQCYTEAMQLNPEDVTNVSNRSNAFYAGRFYEESARDARMCIDMDPKFAKGYYRLAYALKDMGKMNEALAKLDEGLKVVKKGKKALQQLKKKFGKSIDKNSTEQVEAFPSVACTRVANFNTEFHSVRWRNEDVVYTVPCKRWGYQCRY